jgi:hypothetical protein
MDKLLERIWAKVARGGIEECWPYMGGHDSKGYGSAGIRNNGKFKSYRCHRVIFEAVRGYSCSHVRHSCDNPPCCNPFHLLPGDAVSNVQDMIERDRLARGERTGTSKLTDEIALILLHDERPSSTMAGMLGISVSAVRRVRAGQTWSHLNAKLD